MVGQLPAWATHRPKSKDIKKELVPKGQALLVWEEVKDVNSEKGKEAEADSNQETGRQSRKEAAEYI